MVERRAIEPTALSTPDRSWSHGYLATGQPLYISGQTATDADGNVLYPDDLGEQYERVLQNVRHVVENAGGTMGDIVDLTNYVTDMDTWQAENVSDIRFDYVEEPYPCSTTVEVTGLARPEFLVETKAVAYL